jgi:two-component system sensor histidine kinase/response regulator
MHISTAVDRPFSILLAEDDETNQLVTSAILQAAGLAVDVVSDGRQALEALTRRPYDVVLMDGQMPGLDGFEATREIRRRENGMCRTPVVALTASSTAEDRDRCLEAGMDDYLAKPVRRQALVDVVLRWAAPGAAESAGFQDDRGLLPPVPVLDPAIVDELRTIARGRPEFLDEIVWLFRHDVGSKVDELETAVRRSDRPAVQRIAHRIRGAASQVGAAAVARITARLELAGTPATAGEEIAEIADLRREFACAVEALRGVLRTPVPAG